MATLASLTLDVEDMLYGVAQIERPPEDTLLTQVTNTADVTWRFTTPSLWKRGDYAEYLPAAGATGEVVILAEDHPTAGDVIVRRAQQQSTGEAAAVTAGSVFRKNPPHSRVKINRFVEECVDMMLWPGIWYRARRSLTYDLDASYYTLAATDFGVEEVYQLDLTGRTVGTASFDNVTDRWAFAAHGLAIGDHVRFTVAGSATPAEYVVGTDYWVLSVPTVNTFTLGLTADATTVVNGLADSTGDWTFERRLPSLHPFPRGWWDVVTESPARSTGRVLRIRNVYTDLEPVYYTARAKPASASIASLPAQLAAIVPWGACSLLLGGTRAATLRIDPKRSSVPEFSASQFYADSRYFLAMFEELKAQYKKGLLVEKQPLTHWVSLLGVRRG